MAAFNGIGLDGSGDFLQCWLLFKNGEFYGSTLDIKQRQLMQGQDSWLEMV